MNEGWKTVVIGSERKAEIYRHLLDGIQEFSYQGFYDPDDSANSDALGRLVYTYELSGMADVFIFDRHIRHIDLELIENLIKLGKHLLFDGFLIQETKNVQNLINLKNESQNCIHIANVLRNKPLFTTAAQFARKPRFIRIEKSCNAPKPGDFGKWFFQNLAQDIDIVIRLVDSGIRNISARPLFLFGTSPDLLNIHIEFDNDAICHISAGRAVETGVHKFRVFQQDKLFHLDFAENQLLELRPSNGSDQLTILSEPDNHGNHEFMEIPRSVMPFDSWKMEFRNFAENIEKNLSPISNLEHLLAVNKATQWVVDRVQRRYTEV